MQAGILETIDSNMPPPNNSSTYKRKLERKKDKNGVMPPQAYKGITTLVDSNVMLESISYEVEK